jgi:hypothetical protein
VNEEGRPLYLPFLIKHSLRFGSFMEWNVMQRNEKTNGKYRCLKKIIIDCNAVKGNVYFFLFGWRAGLEISL